MKDRKVSGKALDEGPIKRLEQKDELKQEDEMTFSDCHGTGPSNESFMYTDYNYNNI